MRLYDEVGGLNLSHRIFALLTEQFIGIMNLPALSIQKSQALYMLQRGWNGGC